MGRVTLDGTPHQASDWSLSPEWGTHASVNPQVANDQAGEVLIVPNGTGIKANPTVTLTYKDGRWPLRPINVIVVRSDGNTPKTAKWEVIRNDADAIEFAFRGTPRVRQNYGLNYLIFGR